MRLISFITSSHSLHMSQPNFTLSSYICTVEQQPILWKEDGDLSVSGFGGYLDIWNSCCIPKLGPHVCNTASQHFMAERGMISCLGQKNWTHIFFLKNCCTQMYFGFCIPLTLELEKEVTKGRRLEICLHSREQ